MLLASHGRTFAVDIEGRRIVCYSRESARQREFDRPNSLGYRFITVLEDEANYCFVDVPY